MTKIRNNRFKDAPWYSEENDVTVIVGGAGGISSWLSLFLARAGFKLVVYDFDKIEEHNLGGQLYRSKDVTKPKVEALNEILREFTDTKLHTFEQPYDEKSMRGKFMFAGFDNMKARKVMFENWLDSSQREGEVKSEYIFIDGRLLAEQLQIFCVTGDDQASIDLYKEHYLFSDSEVEDGPCTLKQTTHCAALIASLMTGFFTNHITNVMQKNKMRYVPFRYEYFIPLHYSES